MGRIIMVLYMEALLLSVLTIWFLYHIIKKKKIFRWENAPLDMRDFVKRNEKRMNMISNGIIGIILIPAFLRVVLPAVQDFPNINSGNYLEVEGTVTSWNYSDEDKNKTRAIGIMDNKTKKEILDVYKRQILHRMRNRKKEALGLPILRTIFTLFMTKRRWSVLSIYTKRKQKSFSESA